MMGGNDLNPWLNSSGCQDPTAKLAEDRLESSEAANKLLKTLRMVADLAGYDVIQLGVKQRRTNRRFTYKSERY